MKQKDLAIIVLVVVISVIASSALSTKVFTSPKNRHQQVEVAPAISQNLPTPDPTYFSNGALDPTVQIQIGPITNPTPFNGNQ